MAEKLNDIFGNYEGVMGWFVLTLINFFAGYEGMLCLILFVTFVDAVWGVAVALKKGEFVLSDLMRRTIVKLLAYCSIFLVLISIERILKIESGIGTAVIVSIIGLTELWSVCGNILIIYPDLVFFRLLKPALKGEISRKLGIDEDKVESVLETKKQARKQKKSVTDQSA